MYGLLPTARRSNLSPTRGEKQRISDPSSDISPTDIFRRSLLVEPPVGTLWSWLHKLASMLNVPAF